MRVGRVVRSADPSYNGFIVVETLREIDQMSDGHTMLSHLSIIRGSHRKNNINLYSHKMDWFDNEVKSVEEAKLIYGRVENESW